MSKIAVPNRKRRLRSAARAYREGFRRGPPRLYDELIDAEVTARYVFSEGEASYDDKRPGRADRRREAGPSVASLLAGENQRASRDHAQSAVLATIGGQSGRSAVNVRMSSNQPVSARNPTANARHPATREYNLRRDAIELCDGRPMGFERQEVGMAREAIYLTAEILRARRLDEPLGHRRFDVDWPRFFASSSNDWSERLRASL